MYRVTIIDGFESAHYLNGYKGKCENVHGHNYKVEASLAGTHLDENALLFDFTEFKTIMKAILLPLDHALLNELDAFKTKNPSAERIAQYIFDALKAQTPTHITLERVRVWENERQYAEYFE